MQLTRWKASQARSTGIGFKLFYNGRKQKKQNAVGVTLKKEYVNCVVEVKVTQGNEFVAGNRRFDADC